MSTTTRPLNQQCVTTVGQAFAVLGITEGISDEEEIHAAFRKSVKQAADGTGGYCRDMDLLVQAKEFLLAALARVREQVNRDRAHKQEEQEHTRQKEQARAQEQRRAKANASEAEQKEEQAGEPSRLQGPTGEPEPEKQTEEPPPQDDKAPKADSKSQGDGNTGTIETTLRTIMAQLAEIECQRTKEREQAHQREQARAQTGKVLLSHFNELERVMRAIRAILESEEGAQP